MRRSTLPTSSLILLAALTSCSDGLGGFLISDAQEVELGESVDADIRAEYTLRPDGDPVTLWARELAEPLIEASAAWRNPDDFGGYQVEVIDDDQLVNAFAAPGGFVYISTGLIMTASSCAEIAGVVSHELAHVTERHTVKSIEQQFAAETIIGWFLGDALAAEVAGIVYALVVDTAFSREDESEADDIGLQIAFDAGYNPYGLVDFFETLLELEGSGADSLDFLSTHPATGERVRALEALIKDYWGSEVVRNRSQTYECIGTTRTFAQIRAAL